MELPSFADEEVRRAFAASRSGAPPHIGAEVELIPVHAESREPVSLHGDGGSVLALVRAVARRRGWREEVSSTSGAPAFSTAQGRITFEPGGQIEFSARPARSLPALVEALQRWVAELDEEAEARGIALLSVGIDPINGVESTQRQLDGRRYVAMERHFDSLGPCGRRMMRQTASFQICLDLGDEPPARWRLLNALTPVLTAVFANASLYEGMASGFESYRRQVWSALDSSRTGVEMCGDGDPAEYLRFALDAAAFLEDGAGPAPSAREKFRTGAMTPEGWRAHLTTLFPEVRPRGYFELRTVDALDSAWYAAPLVFVSGLVLDRHNARELDARLERPTNESLVKAGRCGLHDPALAALAIELFGAALDGCRRLGNGWTDDATLTTAEAYFARYTRRHLSPSHEATDIVRA
jgi:glutamate--cysteine ligase